VVGPLKRWHPTTTLHGVTNQKTSTRFFTSAKPQMHPCGDTEKKHDICVLSRYIHCVVNGPEAWTALSMAFT
jgi:hypothetical protein